MTMATNVNLIMAKKECFIRAGAAVFEVSQNGKLNFYVAGPEGVGVLYGSIDQIQMDQFNAKKFGLKVQSEITGNQAYNNLYENQRRGCTVIDASQARLKLDGGKIDD